MKKALLFLSVTGLTMVSCKKNYTCECTSVNGSASATSTTTVNETSGNAENACKQKASTVSAGAGSTTTCKLK